MPTEKMYFYEVTPNGQWRLDKAQQISVPNYLVREGIAYETSETPQKSLKDEKESDCYRSGIPKTFFEQKLLLIIFLIRALKRIFLRFIIRPDFFSGPD
jgi:hypothetical protein